MSGDNNHSLPTAEDVTSPIPTDDKPSAEKLENVGSDKERSTEKPLEPMKQQPKEKEKEKDAEAKETDEATNSFRIPKKILVESKPADDTFRLAPPSSAPEPTTNHSTSPKLNKAIISNLNKSLKAKQKIISSKEPLPKNSTLITEIINRSPTSNTFPSSIALPSNNVSSSNMSSNSALNTPDIAENIPSLPITPALNSSKENPSSSKNKKVSKQTSTKTDFFAAKLASAVDDVDSSDSDETFVYENNVNEDFNDINDNSNGDSNEASETRLQSAPKLPEQQGELENDLNSINANTSVEHSNNNTLTTASNINESLIANDAIDETISDLPDISDIRKPAQTASSIHSVISNAPATSKSQNSVNNKPMINASVNSSFSSSNQFLETLLKTNYRPSNSRATSTPILNLNDEQQPPNQINSAASGHKSLLNQRSSSPFTNSLHNASTNGLNVMNIKHSNFNNPITNSLHDHDDKYSFDQVDDTGEDDVDDVSSHDSYTSHRNLVSSSNTTFPVNNHTNNINPQINSIKTKDLRTKDTYQEPTSSIASKSTTKKKSTTSSKLRSTTSKLFDKKGSQPRRYSIIPDDIDIEDFDDELIYYDNNVRFPYNDPNTNNTQSLNFNETSALMGNNSRIPHYRSLNLGLQSNNRKPNKNKRYMSAGNTFMNTPNSPNSQSNLNADIFPFPYPDQNQNPNYYYGFDEYDEEASSIQDGMQLQFENPSRKASGRLGNPHLSPNHSHFLLPRKRSIYANNYSYLKRTLYTLISIIGILTIGFVMGFVLATTKDLTNVTIAEMNHPLVSQDELVFNIIVDALNPGWFTIDIEEVELDIFAKSGYLPSSENDLISAESTVETVLLGSVYNLESAISFPGGFFNRQSTQQIGEVKLVGPGKNLTNSDPIHLTKGNSTDPEPDNSKKWEVISKNPFDLVVRGILKYNLPLSRGLKSVVVTKTSFIDPTVDDSASA